MNDAHTRHLRDTWNGIDTPGQNEPLEGSSFDMGLSDLGPDTDYDYADQPAIFGRAQEIAYQLATFGELTDENTAEYLALEYELAVTREAKVMMLRVRHPRYVAAVTRWAEEELKQRVQAGASFEEIYRTETQIIDELIAEARQDGEDEMLIEVAAAVRDAYDARGEYEVVKHYARRDELALAA